MKDPNNPCIFCSIRKNELIFENSLAYASKDSYPVTKFHSLVVPKRCIKNYFELNDKEILDLKAKNKWSEIEFFKSDYIASKDVNAWLGLYKVK